jgi:ATP-binding cassette, subfamily C, bacterial LapB
MDSRCAQSLSKALLQTRQHKTEPTALLQHLRSFEQLRELLTGVFLLTFIDLPFIAVFLVVIAIIHPLLLLIVVGAILLICIQIVSSHRHMAKGGQLQMHAARQAHNQWFTTLSGLDSIQAHGTEDLFAHRLNRLQFKARQTSNTLRKHLFDATQRLHLVQQGTWVLIISLGVYFIINQQLTVGGLIAASMLGLRCFAPLQRLHGHVVQTHAAQASFQELDQFMGQLENKHTAHALALSRPTRLAIEQVSVTKPDNTDNILQAIDLRFHAGDRIGIIGPTGSGKTSILKLLARQFEPSNGQFTIDHLDVQHIHPSELGMHIGYAVQPPSLIKGSLLENIRFERPHIGVEDCVEIIDALGMAEWVNGHKDGIHMPIESHGSNLSSGQKQLISLCRALVGSPALVLLDEPTVCLDQATENRLIQRLDQFPANSMLVFTTHKLNLLKCADQLVLMNKGRIHAQGDKADVLHHANELSKQSTSKQEGRP